MKSFWDKAAPVYDIMELVNRPTARRLESITRENIRSGDRVLDCAAGTGMLTFAAAEKAETVICTDLSRPMLISALKKARRRGVYNIRFMQGDICSLPFGAERFDRVMAGNVLHLLECPEKAAAGLIGMTKKGGKILLPTYISEEHLLSRLCVWIFKVMGARFAAGYTAESYKSLIGRIARENGCKGCEITVVKGIVPAAYAIITK